MVISDQFIVLSVPLLPSHFSPVYLLFCVFLWSVSLYPGNLVNNLSHLPIVTCIFGSLAWYWVSDFCPNCSRGRRRLDDFWSFFSGLLNTCRKLMCDGRFDQFYAFRWLPPPPISRSCLGCLCVPGRSGFPWPRLPPSHHFPGTPFFTLLLHFLCFSYFFTHFC